MELDQTHLRMLDLLRSDARTSVSALAEAVGISRANAYARVAAMEAAGVIKGYHAEVSASAVGKPIAALVFVSLWQNRWADFRAQLRTLPELDYFAVTTGQLDAMLLVRSEDVAGVHALVVGELSQWPSVKATETVFLMDEESFSWALRPSGRSLGPREDAEHGLSRFVGAPASRPRRR